MVDEFKKDDLVEVGYYILTPDNQKQMLWRNAVYLNYDKGFHVVQYADGHTEMLNNKIHIRKPKINKPME